MTQSGYRLLIRRAWSSDKIFVYCAAAPFAQSGASSFNLPEGVEPEGERCVNVRVDDVIFHPDGTLAYDGTWKAGAKDGARIDPCMRVEPSVLIGQQHADVERVHIVQ